VEATIIIFSPHSAHVCLITFVTLFSTKSLLGGLLFKANALQLLLQILPGMSSKLKSVCSLLSRSEYFLKLLKSFKLSSDRLFGFRKVGVNVVH